MPPEQGALEHLALELPLELPGSLSAGRSGQHYGTDLPSLSARDSSALWNPL